MYHHFVSYQTMLTACILSTQSEISKNMAKFDFDKNKFYYGLSLAVYYCSLKIRRLSMCVSMKLLDVELRNLKLKGQSCHGPLYRVG